MIAYTVAYDEHNNWTYYKDGDEIPVELTIWHSGLSLKQATSAVDTDGILLTHSVTGPDGDVGLFSDEETAFAFAQEGEKVAELQAPVTRIDVRPVDGTDGFGVW